MSNKIQGVGQGRGVTKGGRKKRKAPGVKRTGTEDAMYWRDVPLEAVYAVLCAVTEAGGAPMFIRSSDGGALGVRVYHDDVDLENAWAAGYEAVTDMLHEIAEDYVPHKRRD